MKVVEIFKSIDGEGVRAGYPATFIRLFGCNLRCGYCDTKYSYEKAVYEEMKVEEIVNEALMYGCPKVTLTGGEPLYHKDVDLLIDSLVREGFEVNIETNGSIDIRNYIKQPKILITMDYKCPSSGMEAQMNLNNLNLLRSVDVLKFVVGCEYDLEVCNHVRKNTKAQIFISPVFGRIEPKEIVEYMLDNDMFDCRVQLQMHKIIWNPEERGV